MNKLFSIFFLILLFTGRVMAQWESIPSPSNVDHLAKCRNYLFISSLSSTGLIRHNLDNNSQVVMYNPDDNLPFTANGPKELICIDSVVLYGEGGYVYRSVDLGKTWKRLVMPNVPYYSFLTERDQLIILLDRAFLKSQNLGNSFQTFYITALTGSVLMPLLYKDSKLYVAGPGDFFTLDLNGSIQPINNMEYFQDYMTARDTILIGAKYQRIQKSTDRGYSWSTVKNYSEYPSMKVVYGIKYFNDELFYIGTEGIFKSRNDGVSWRSLNENLPTDIKIRSITFDEDYIYIGSFNHGAFKRPFGYYFRYDTINICQGDSVMINNQYRKNAGIFYDTIDSKNDWDSIKVMTLLVYNLGSGHCITGIKNIENDIYIYPNPASNFLYLNNIEFKYYEIYGLNGSQIEKSNQKVINLKGYNNGIYFIRVIDENGNAIIKKIIVVK